MSLWPWACWRHAASQSRQPHGAMLPSSLAEREAVGEARSGHAWSLRWQRPVACASSGDEFDATQVKNVASKQILVSVLGCNLAVFALWQKARVGTLLHKLLVGNMICSRIQIRYGLLQSMVLSNISHSRPLHLMINNLVFYQFGRLVIDATAMSPGELGLILLALSIGTTGFHLACHRRVSMSGMSGVVMGLVTLHGLFLGPSESFIMLLPLPGVELCSQQVADLALLSNLIGMFVMTCIPTVAHRLRVAFGAHVGGTLAGLGYGGAALSMGDERFKSPWRAHEELFGPSWLRTADTVRAPFHQAYLWTRSLVEDSE